MSNEIGKRIKTARKIRGLSQEKLSKEVGINHQTLRNYENEDNSKLNILKELSDSLDVPLDLLVNGIDDRFKDKYSFEDLIKNKNLYNEYLDNLRWQEAKNNVESFNKKVLIFNEMIDFIEMESEMHGSDTFDIIFQTASHFVKEIILKSKNDNKNDSKFQNAFLDRINVKLKTKNFKTLSNEDEEKLKSILPELEKMFDI